MADIHSTFRLRPTVPSDLEHFYQFQLDEVARHLAAFTPEDSTDKAAYLAKHTRLLADPEVHNQTILIAETVAGNIAKFVMHGDAEITYWIDRKFWGKGLASATLQAFLALEHVRPLFGRVAFDNYGSQKVLEKCGFTRVGVDSGFAGARQQEIEEYIYKLD